MAAKKKMEAVKKFKDKIEEDTFFYYHLLTMVGYASALLLEAKKTPNDMPARWHQGCNWYIAAVENVVYKQIPPPKCP